MRELIRQQHPSDVYNMDEAELFYRALPRTSLCLVRAPALKQRKDRVTMVVAVNSDGSDKLPLLFLGRSQRPQRLSRTSTGVHYVVTARGWMTASVFQRWLLQLDERVSGEVRTILILVDNTPSHKLGDVALTNVTAAYSPLHTTSLLQLMDQGVIGALWHGFRKHRRETAVRRHFDGVASPYDVTLVQSIRWCIESW